MKRRDFFLTLLVAMIGLALLATADRPLTPEAQIARDWYAALCRGDFDTLAELTYTGSLDRTQFQRLAQPYSPCTAVVDPNRIGFEAIPPALTGTVSLIKFVAVNVSYDGAPPGRNHILSVRSGVHVIFWKSGAVHVLPDWIGQPLGPAVPPGEWSPLSNNDGLNMGHARVTGRALALVEGGSTLIGVPVELRAERAWGAYTLRLFADDARFEPLLTPDPLPMEYRDSFVPASSEAVEPPGLAVPAQTAREGIVWFRAVGATPASPEPLRLWIEVRQTPWDYRSLGSYIRVEAP